MASSPTRAEGYPTFERVEKENLPLEERIRQRAHEIWLQNGSPAGTDLADWLEAEAEVLR